MGFDGLEDTDFFFLSTIVVFLDIFLDEDFLDFFILSTIVVLDDFLDEDFFFSSTVFVFIVFKGFLLILDSSYIWYISFEFNLNAPLLLS